MGATPFVIALVGLVVPIAMVLLAIVFDIVLVAWLLFRWSNDRLRRALADAKLRRQVLRPVTTH